jgi:tetratricopeptide (TPR) repeat protein
VLFTRFGSLTRSSSRVVRTALLVSATVFGPLAPGAHAQNQDARLELSTSSDAAKEHFWAGVNDAQNVFPVRAAMHFEMALEADPDFGLAKVFHGFVKPGLAGADRQAEIAEGLAAMSAASTNEILVAIALREWSSGNAPAASRMLETASALMPADPYVASYATQLAGARGDQTDVITRLQNLSTAFPELAAPHNNIAYQQWARGNQAAAMASVETYVEMVPDHPNAHDSYAELLQWGGHYRQAFDEYNRAAELDANFDQAYIGAAEVLFLAERNEQAREQIVLGIEHAPSPQARIASIRALANMYMVDGDSDNAMAQLGRAVSEAEAAGLNGAGAFSHEQAALTSAVMGNGQFVEEHLAEAVELRGSENAVNLGTAGLAYAVAGDGARAREASDRLAAASNAPFWQSMSRAINAMVYLQDDQTEMALEELSEANSGDPIVQALLAECYENMNMGMAAAAQRVNVTGNRQINLANPFGMFAFVLASDR